MSWKPSKTHVESHHLELFCAPFLLDLDLVILATSKHAFVTIRSVPKWSWPLDLDLAIWPSQSHVLKAVKNARGKWSSGAILYTFSTRSWSGHSVNLKTCVCRNSICIKRRVAFRSWSGQLAALRPCLEGRQNARGKWSSGAVLCTFSVRSWFGHPGNFNTPYCHDSICAKRWLARQV